MTHAHTKADGNIEGNIPSGSPRPMMLRPRKKCHSLRIRILQQQGGGFSEIYHGPREDRRDFCGPPLVVSYRYIACRQRNDPTERKRAKGFRSAVKHTGPMYCAVPNDGGSLHNTQCVIDRDQQAGPTVQIPTHRVTRAVLYLSTVTASARILRWLYGNIMRMIQK